MTNAQKRSVLLAERALQAAMLASDVEALDRLLHPELVAVGPNGQLIDKAGDLAAHRSGIFKITRLKEEELRMTVLGELVLVVERAGANDLPANLQRRPGPHIHLQAAPAGDHCAPTPKRLCPA
jgi:hypothetical protein